MDLKRAGAVMITAILVLSLFAQMQFHDGTDGRANVVDDRDWTTAGNFTQSDINDSIADAADWLFSAQKANGGLKPWEGYSKTCIVATANAILAWLCAGYNFTNESVSDALDYVRSKDQGDGTYSDDSSNTVIKETKDGMVIDHLAGYDVSDSQEWMVGKADEDGKFGNFDIL